MHKARTSMYKAESMKCPEACSGHFMLKFGRVDSRTVINYSTENFFVAITESSKENRSVTSTVTVLSSLRRYATYTSIVAPGLMSANKGSS